ncbi:MAG: DUF1440 domain-containing protein [Chloroflexota bacterium]|nr:DUF1440 domain-containing protein [Chloroflexota bacterium]
MIGQMARGAIAGAAATWLMDQVTTAMMSSQKAEVTAREEAARPNGKDAVSNLVDRLEGMLGLDLDDKQRSMTLQTIHFGLGIGPGALYALLRHRLPLLGAGGGLLFGAALWAVNDEYMNTALGLAAPFGDYPMETHIRGLVGHLALGGATDSILDLLGG